MKVRKQRSGQSLRAKLRSPGRPTDLRRTVRVLFWAAIARGQQSEEAAMDARISSAVGVRWFRQSGGMPPSQLSPSAPALSGRYLAFEEREQIALLQARGCGVRQIGYQLQRAASTISRELRRNAATRSGKLEYRASTAQWHSDRAARRPKLAKIATNAALRKYVQERLSGRVLAPGGVAIRGPQTTWNVRRHGPRQHRRWARAWSPAQISNRLVLDFPVMTSMRISH